MIAKHFGQNICPYPPDNFLKREYSTIVNEPFT